MNWNWKEFKLILPGFMILRLYSGSNIVELELKVKEESEERQSLNLTFNSFSFGEFIDSLKKINSKVEKKDFPGQAFKYDFSSENKVELNFYFNKSEWTQFYKFLENCQKEIIEQAREYEKLTRGEIK